MSAPSSSGIPAYLVNVTAEPPPPGQVVNFMGPTKQPAILATGSVMVVLTTAFVLARLYAATRIVHRIGKEDWACVIATVLSFTYLGFVLHLSYAARHLWNVPVWWFSGEYWKLRFSQNIIMPIAFIFTRLTFFLLYLRLFGNSKPFRWACYFGIGFYTLSNFLDVPISMAYEFPTHGRPWAAPDTLKRWIRVEPISLYLGGVNIASDLYIIILPMPMIWRLQMSLERKLGVMAIFTSGLFVLTASIVGMVYRYRLVHDGDTNWNEGSFVCAIMAELNVAIMISSMPALASIINHHFPNSHVISSICSSFRRLRSKPDSKYSKEISNSGKIYSQWNRRIKGRNVNTNDPYCTNSKTCLENRNFYPLEAAQGNSMAAAYTEGPCLETGNARGITKKVDMSIHSNRM